MVKKSTTQPINRLAELSRQHWIIIGVFVLVAFFSVVLAIIAAYITVSKKKNSNSGSTTLISAILAFVIGVMSTVQMF